MQRSSHAALTDILRAAGKLPIERRFAWLREACQGDQDLYREAMAAFKLDITHAEWWSDTTTTRSSAGHPTIGLHIGRYLVTEKIGSGGTSDVLLGVPRDDAGPPTVAIKIIRRAHASPQLHTRLKIERQILGALDHPNIARLLDGGSTAEGMPYLVMEYLQGQPIDRYCDLCRLDLRSRLRLFQSVCRAVHAAHRLSIVHRDLKPSNVLVTAEGVPKLVDFGIAKVLDEPRDDQTMVVTHADVRVLTPDYASPEQLRGDVITPASDIYSLGVLLYELLSGANPRRAQPAATGTQRGTAQATTPGAALPALNRRIDSALTGVPLTGAPDWLAELCHQRSTQPVALNHELASLSPLVLKALERTAHQRYDSAESFAASIDGYLGSSGATSTDSSTRPAPPRASARAKQLMVIAAAVATAIFVSLAIYVA
jgi:serine/threonine protein kinase